MFRILWCHLGHNCQEGMWHAGDGPAPLSAVGPRCAWYNFGNRATTVRDLKWQPFSNWRCSQRLSLFYKILNSDLNIPPETVDLKWSTTTTRRSHKWKLQHLTGQDKSSPYGKGTVVQTIPEWNKLNHATAQADSFTSFKSQLASTAP